MKRNISLAIENLTDEQVLKEFTKRFECDGAVLIYMEDKKEFGFGRWTNPNGRVWVNQLFKTIKNSPLPQLDNNRVPRIRRKESNSQNNQLV